MAHKSRKLSLNFLGTWFYREAFYLWASNEYHGTWRVASSAGSCSGTSGRSSLPFMAFVLRRDC